jgi:type II secretory pathway component PulF
MRDFISSYWWAILVLVVGVAFVVRVVRRRSSP